MASQKTFFFLLGGLFLIALLLLFIFFNPNNTTLVDSDQFEQLIKSEEVYVINAHTPYIGEIEGTDLNAENWENMDSYLNQLPEDKSTPIAIYCRSGRMSGISSHQLLELGYTNVYDLEGGMNSWEQSGRELVDSRQQTGETKEFDVEASNWQFEPSNMEVNQGDKVILNVQSIDTYHGIYLGEFNVNEQLPPGETVRIEFIADKKGVFSFFCSIPCGHGHSSMGGQLVVN